MVIVKVNQAKFYGIINNCIDVIIFKSNFNKKKLENKGNEGNYIDRNE